MGTWGPGPFDNDAAADLLGAEDGGPLDAARDALTEAAATEGELDAMLGAAVVAAAAIIAAGRGLGGELPADLVERLDGAVATPADVRAALAALARVAEPDCSELAGLWAPAPQHEQWRRSLHVLTERLRGDDGVERERGPSPARRRARRRTPEIGDIYEIQLPSGRLRYVQYALDGLRCPIVAVLPGWARAPLTPARVAAHAGRDYSYLIQAPPEALERSGIGRVVADAAPPPLAEGSHALFTIGARRSLQSPHGWFMVGFEPGGKSLLSEQRFAERFPGVDQSRLAPTAVPFPATLAADLDRGVMPRRTWRPRRHSDCAFFAFADMDARRRFEQALPRGYPLGMLLHPFPWNGVEVVAEPAKLDADGGLSAEIEQAAAACGGRELGRGAEVTRDVFWAYDVARYATWGDTPLPDDALEQQVGALG